MSKLVLEKINENLHLRDGHPIKIIKDMIYDLFPGVEKFDNLNPHVSVRDNFDLLRIPKDHVSRSKSDTSNEPDMTNPSLFAKIVNDTQKELVANNSQRC